MYIAIQLVIAILVKVQLRTSGQLATVQFNYNFKTWRVYTHGNTTQGYTVHVSCLRGPRFSQRVNMHFTCKIPCNMRGVAFTTCVSISHLWHFTSMELYTCIILVSITHDMYVHFSEAHSTYYHKLLKHQALSFDEPSDEPS